MKILLLKTQVYDLNRVHFIIRKTYVSIVIDMN